MKQDISDSIVILKDGVGNQMIFANQLPRKMPKNQRAKDRAMERAHRVGGKGKTARMRRKKSAAMIRAWIYATNVTMNISWGRCGCGEDEPIDVDTMVSWEAAE